MLVFAVGVMVIVAIDSRVGGRLVPAADIVANATEQQAHQTAILAGGCFWGVEAVFEHVRGVVDVVSGYTGGTARTAHYSHVSSGTTAHVEAVRIVFDPRQIQYTDLLRIYFSVAHDPTETDRQGPDLGPQYRSAIFATTDEQMRLAGAYIHQLNAAGVFRRPVATTLSQATSFHRAEALHQNYVARFPDNLYVRMYDAPLVAALAHRFPQRYRPRPAWLTPDG